MISQQFTEYKGKGTRVAGGSTRLAGMRGYGAASTKWTRHVKKYAKKHNVSYKDALTLARSTYIRK